MEKIAENLKLLKKSDQAYGQFNGGEILENKPIGFPHEGGSLKPYSNLFYWAHAYTSDRASTIGLHPHKGFEIMSIVLKGSIEHYDSKLKNWIRLEEGDVQLIRAGSGISHSEKLNPHSAMFQIWFDPGLQQSLKKEAAYRDYRKEEFEINSYPDRLETIIRDGKGPVEMDSPVKIRKIILAPGKHEITIAPESFASIYVLDGPIRISKHQADRDDFILVENPGTVQLENMDSGIIYLLENPLNPGYPTYSKILKPN